MHLYLLIAMGALLRKPPKSTSTAPKERPLKISDLARLRPTAEHRSAMFTELTTGSDRTAALIAAAELDHALKDAILTNFIELEPNEHYELFRGVGAPLGSLRPKIRFGYALQIYGNITKTDLIKIANIRNAFAHSAMALDFTTEAISSECKNLKCLREYFVRKISGHDREFSINESSPRMIFLATTFAIMTVLGEHTLNAHKLMLDRTKGILEFKNQHKMSVPEFNELIRRLNDRAIP